MRCARLVVRCGLALAVPVLVAALITPDASASAGQATAKPSTKSFLAGLTMVSTVASTIPSNGDENPYAVLVAPVSSGVIHKGDVLVDNFNAVTNKQGTGSTIMDIAPGGSVKLFAAIPKHLAGCPGGIGLTTAMTMLKTGWVIVGSTPSTDGTTKTAGAGCLVVLSSSGKVVSTITGPQIDGPWDMATIDDGTSATLYLTNTLIGVKAPGQPVIDKGDLVRIALRESPSSAPSVTSTTVIASGFPEEASSAAFVIGPTGVAVVGGIAYVADPLANAIVEVPNATTRTSSVGIGTKLTSGGDLHHPIAMVAAPNGDLLVTNGLNGDVVEVSTSGHQVREFEIDPDPAQSPPGSGDLFGLAVAPSGKGVYFAKDDTNTLALLS